MRSMADQTKPSPEVRDHEIFNRVNRLQFRGVLLGEATTWRPGSTRWIEISIYRTVAGKYIVHRQGMSRLYHRAGAACQSGSPVGNRDLDEESVPCPTCRPPDLAELDRIQDEDQSVYWREVPLSSADVATTPDQIVKILIYKGRLTTVATEAIARAVANDDQLKGIFNQVERIA